MMNMQIAAALLLALLPAPQDEERIQKLIQNFSDASKDVRSKAVDELAKIGRPAIEALRVAAKSSDLEVKGLANQAIEKIEWVGLDQLKKYAREHLDEGATVEQSKMKGVARWFPDARFYEVAGAAAGNQQQAMINMGMTPPKSLFAIRKYEEGFHRLVVKGIYSSAAISAFVQKSKIVLPNDDSALDFAVAYMEIQSAAVAQNQNAWMMNGGSKLDRIPDGWTLLTGMYGGQVAFKVDKSGTLVEINPKAASLNQWGQPGGGADERGKLEAEKLRLEIELLKKQLEKK
jgi:HEAT repeat protein